MNLGYKDGHNKNEAAVYEGVFNNGSYQVKRRINGRHASLLETLHTFNNNGVHKYTIKPLNS